MEQMDELMDTSRLSQKELLILLNERYGRIEKQITDYSREVRTNYKEFNDLKLEVEKIKIQLKVWSAIMAGAAAVIASLLTRFIYH